MSKNSFLQEFLNVSKLACSHAIRLDKPFFVFRYYGEHGDPIFVNSDERPGSPPSMYSHREYVEHRPDGTVILFRPVKMNSAEYDAFDCAPFDPARV